MAKLTIHLRPLSDPKRAIWTPQARLSLMQQLEALECKRRGKHNFQSTGIPFVRQCGRCGARDTELDSPGAGVV